MVFRFVREITYSQRSYPPHFKRTDAVKKDWRDLSGIIRQCSFIKSITGAQKLTGSYVPASPFQISNNLSKFELYWS